jgi:DNA-directed RNA polymerase sigma subunit (sigma70/sigma32)
MRHGATSLARHMPQTSSTGWPATLCTTQIHQVLGGLIAREAGIVMLRFGLTDGRQRTLDEIDQVYGVTRERIR